MQPVIIVFAKAPVAGRVKTRLCPPLSPAEAAALHSAFVQDTLASLESLTGVAVELHTDIETDAWRDLRVPRQLQHEGDLGLKMLKALAGALSSGHPQAAILGSDSPTLPASHLTTLFASPADVALGPTGDGGYYAIAVRRIQTGMFRGVRWSSPHALDDTLRACESSGLSTATGPAWYDIDCFEDLSLLPLAEDIPAHTAAALRSITARGGKRA